MCIRDSLLNSKGDRGGTDYTMTEYLEMSARAKSVESMIAIDRRNVVLTGESLPEAVVQDNFSSNAFEFFGVPPLFGRTFSSVGSEQGATGASPPGASGRPNVEPMAVLSYFCLLYTSISLPNAAFAKADDLLQIDLGCVKFRPLHLIQSLLPEFCFLLPKLGETIVADRFRNANLRFRRSTWLRTHRSTHRGNTCLLYTSRCV